MKCPICGRELEEKLEVSVYWSLNGLSESERKTLEGHDVGFACPCNEHDNIGWNFLLLDGVWFGFTKHGWRLLPPVKEKVIFT